MRKTNSNKSNTSGSRLNTSSQGKLLGSTMNSTMASQQVRVVCLSLILGLLFLAINLVV